MDIAIVSPSPKPFAMGGIEKLMLGMYYHIDELTNHRVELLKLPTEENGFWELLNSYKTFYYLDVTHFDQVITCKYPAWMVQHPNHTIYMAHHLRGLFDTYHFVNMSLKVEKTNHQAIKSIVEYIDNAVNMLKPLHVFFELLDSLYEHRASVPEQFFSFPGPFIRKVIHFLDSWALHPTRIRRYLAISENVTKREHYFPRNMKVPVIYPPTSLTQLEEGAYEYFLVIGRLDGAKRVNLIVDAFKNTKNQTVRLLIAGTGPDEQKLKTAAAIDKRIEFLGYINNEKLTALYKDALAVIYIPFDEDYGLVTIEAMKCAKPVITCSDSGGTNEFVTHMKTGLIAKPNVKSLEVEITRLANDKELAVNLGKSAQKKVEYINWTYLIDGLITNDKREKIYSKPELKSTSRTIQPKKNILVLSTYPVIPQLNGGQLRIFNLSKNLADYFNVTVLSIGSNDEAYSRKRVERVTEIVVPKSAAHAQEEWKVQNQVGISVIDVVMNDFIKYTPKFIEEYDKEASMADIIIVSHPYLFELAMKYKDDKFIVHDSHNFEFALKKSMLPKNKTSNILLDNIYKIEKLACENSHLICACSQDDITNLKQHYNVTSTPFIFAPNGVDCEKIVYVDFETRQANKRKLNLDDEKIVVFIGSWHKPNLEAVEEIIKLAVKMKEYKFIIMGSQCSAFKNRKLPLNLTLAGIVNTQLKDLIYSVADVAINPMINGSGTNLKIAEFIASGLPVVSTEIGARGYSLEHGESIYISDINNFDQSIKNCMEDKERTILIIEKALANIQKNYEWKQIASNMVKAIQSGTKT